MERASLNSTRNFKLPPIQAAAVANSSFRDASWISQTGHSSTIKSNGIAQETFSPRVTNTKVHSQIVTAPKRIYNEVSNPGQVARLDLDLGHNLPRPYAVLPPIRSENEMEQRHRNPRILHGKVARFERGRQLKRRTEHDSHLEIKTQQSGNFRINYKQSEKRSHKFKLGEGFLEENEESNDLKERKRSANYVLFMKGTRIGRRCGVCIENEQTLINVCELLKEIFLRRNMEEMYLI